ncbi:hypothetical protein Tco_0843599 [Tanacetum coccineum]|uniref:Uncharacterized protein n=1 Tax=Tanacetum coccineum TaxID=301880 RepID=A0ABQ5B4R1_9ASTR
MKEPATVALNDTVGNVVNLEKEVFDLSGNTCVTTHLAIVNQPSLCAKHKDTTENTASDGNLSNVEVVSRAYQSLGQCVLSHELDRLRTDLQIQMQANSGLTKELTLLDNSHSSCSEWEKELVDNLRDMEKGMDDWGKTSSEQVERIKGLEEALVPQSKQLAASKELVRVLEGEKADLAAELAQAEVDRHKLVRSSSRPCLGRTEDQVATMLSETRDLDIEGSKSWKERHRELFIMQYPYIRKVANSYRLSVDALMKVSPDVPPPPRASGTRTSTADGTGDVAQQSPTYSKYYC